MTLPERPKRLQECAFRPIGDDGGLVPVDSAAWLKCEIENTQNIRGYQVVTGRVKAQKNLDRAPLIWQQDSFFKLAPA